MLDSEEFTTRFVRTWETSRRLEDVARAMGITKEKCSQYANKLRRKRVKLKKMKVPTRGGAPEVAKLNDLVARCRAGTPPIQEPEPEEDAPTMTPEELIRWMLAQT